MSSILNSTNLVKSIIRRGMIPSDQITFTTDDFLEMATEEVNIGLMGYLLDCKQDYLVYFQDFPMQEGKINFPIPYRAHGDKLKDACIISGGRVYEIHQIDIDELSDYQNGYNTYSSRMYYVQNNDIVLIDPNNSGETLRMYFYMRPNSLVQKKRVGIIQSITDSVEVDNINPLDGSISNISVASQTQITSTAHGLSSGDKVSIESSNSTPSIDGEYIITVVDANTFQINIAVTVLGNSGGWTKMMDTKVLSLDIFPSNFDSNLLYDFVQAKSPNKIISYDIAPNAIDQSLKIISFNAEDFSANISVSDYVSLAEETYVPNLPTELHPILAQRVAVACLEALGDEQGKISAERKLEKMEKSALGIVTNRVENSPKKIKNRYSTLRQNSARRF